MAGATDHTVHVCVLGPLRLEVDGAAVEVRGTKRKAVLALLAMASPHAVGTDRLIDAVWPDDPPESGRAALQSHVSRLRRHLGPAGGRLVSTGTGYCLRLDGADIDVTQARSDIDAARDHLADDPQRACELAGAALRRWRGEPLAGLTSVAELSGWARTLSELRLGASDLLVEAALAAGDHSTAVAAATAAVAAEPLREAGVVLAVRALAADGRAADALRMAHDYRRTLAEEAGLDPSPALAAIEHAVADGTLARSERAGGSEHLGGGDDIAGGGADRAGPRPVVPAPVDGLIGRDAELAGIGRLVAAERLVTLVGPGGVGKTRLAMAVAQQAGTRHPVTVVRLAPVTDGAAVPAVLAHAVGLRADVGNLVDRCALRLRAGRHLLVIDNCEHVLAAVTELAMRLLESCPELTILATSRERLAVPVEQTCRIAPLPMPDPHRLDESPGTPSVALLLARARRVVPDLRLDRDGLARVGRIVRRLDGMPLAIELAAGRLATMTLADLDDRLDRVLDLLGAGAPTVGGPDARHRTLRAAIEWSYDLLPERERRLFRNLAVFPDGFDLASAEAVAADVGGPGDPAGAIAHLVDTSMLVAALDGQPRYRMLDTLRAFGLDRLRAAGEEDDATARFLRWAADQAAWIGRTIPTAAEAEADARLLAELGNLREAWRLAGSTGDVDLAGTLLLGLYEAVSWRDVVEVWGWARDLVDDPRLADHPMAAVVVAIASEGVWFTTGDLDRAEELARRGLEVAADDLGRALCTWALADVMLFRGRYADARTLLTDAGSEIHRPAERWIMSAVAAAYDGDLAGARALLEQVATVDTNPTLWGFARYATGEIEGAAGRWAEAEAGYRDALTAAAATGAGFLEGIASVGLVSLQAASGDDEAALGGYRDLIDRWERTGGWTQQWTTLRNLADLLDRLGDTGTAARLRAAADAAPEAAAVPGRARVATMASAPTDDRQHVLAEARAAIARLLGARRPAGDRAARTAGSPARAGG